MLELLLETDGAMTRLLTIALLSFFMLSSISIADEGRSDLSEVMAQIEQSLEELKEHINDDSSQAENLARIDSLISAGERAVTLDPPRAKALVEAERETFVQRYRAALQAMLSDAKDLRSLVEENAPPQQRNEQLMKVYSHQERGHQRFQED